ncbi:MAG: hypothetical protein ACOC3Z_02760, partial [Nanoarchaeota archaeon]
MLEKLNGLKEENLVPICMYCKGIYIGDDKKGKDNPKNWISRKDNFYKYNQLIIDSDLELGDKILTHSICSS